MSARAGQSTQRAPWLLVAAVTIAALVAAALAGLVLGRWAGERASAPTVVELAIEDPALAAADADEGWTTRGGFTGFGGLPALPGEVWRAAHVVESEPGRLVITSGGATTTIDYRATSRLFEIVPGDSIEVGDIVVVRIVDGVIAAMLVVPPDVEEGSGSGSR
ncbi:MAG: hypothetical protein OXH97_04065 [Chloroflexota bacterium]|nr:hypothetical protein [Chloroflexota bacterium]